MSASTVPRIKSRKASPAVEVANLLAKRSKRIAPSKNRRVTTTPGVVRYEALGRLLAQKRRDENLSLREVGQAIGVSATTLHRMEKGRVADTDHVAALSQWLGIGLDDLTGSSAQEDREQQIKSLILADPKLDRGAREALCSIFSTLYRQMSKE